MDNENTKQSVHLPQEIIEEILPWLPVKSLLRFRCVSKSWRSLMASKRFMETQFQNSTKKTSLGHYRVVFFCQGAVTRQCSLYSLLYKPSINASRIDNPTNNPSEICRVVGCCNGLLCLLNLPAGRPPYLPAAGRFFLWNPATRDSIELPKLDNRITKYGFGFDEKSGAYKVFAVLYEDEYLMGKVYSTNTNSWKTVEGRAFIRPGNRVGQFACGKLHWFNKNEHDIVSFDMGREVFGRIKLSFDPYNWFDLQFGEIKGHLCVSHHDDVRNGRLDIWVMKKYGVKDSWFKLLTIPLVKLKLPLFPRSKVCVRPNGEVLLRYGHYFKVYRSKYNEFFAAKTIKSLGEYDDAQVYV